LKQKSYFVMKKTNYYQNLWQRFELSDSNNAQEFWQIRSLEIGTAKGFNNTPMLPCCKAIFANFESGNIESRCTFT